jgi:pSer/pThr/pTyr-binding forkhead associated (FHA) protein
MTTKLVSLDYEMPKCNTSLDRLPVTIGSDSDVEMRLNDPSVSPHHCRIEQVGEQLVVSDLASTHGTYINGDLITTKSVLQAGDELTIGMKSFFVQSDHTGDA